tara:strand:- start:300 stop:809 length:510 start_codon:yes stop_codon:yes gene_type:complete
MDNDGEVDFDDKRINGIKLDSSLSTCMVSMILDLMLGDFEDPLSPPPTTELIDEVFDILGGSFVANDRDFITIYKVGNIGSKNGETTVTWNQNTSRYEATIIISENLVNNGTKLAVAKTVLHESIHAFLEYTSKQFPLVFNNTNGDFGKLVAAWQVHLLFQQVLPLSCA